MNGRFLDLYGLLTTPQNLVLLNALQDEEENVYENLFLNAIKSIAILNADQKAAFDAFVGAVLPDVTCTNLQENGTSTELDISPSCFYFQKRQFFSDATGSSGKTFVLCAIYSFLESKIKNVVAVATSSIVAQILSKGRTARSAIRIQITCN